MRSKRAVKESCPGELASRGFRRSCQESSYHDGLHLRKWSLLSNPESNELYDIGEAPAIDYW